MNKYKDWIVRFYASHKDIPKGHSDCETLTELVRCKECKWWHGHGMYADTYLWRYPWCGNFKGNEFCSKGERKE